MKADTSPDAVFYVQPRFVNDIDAGAIAAVTALYRDMLPEGGAILDLMSSWVSHLPKEAAYGGVTGLGINAAELAANPRFTPASASSARPVKARLWRRLFMAPINKGEPDGNSRANGSCRFRFTMEPAFESPLTLNEHQMFNEACERWRKSVIHAMLPWSTGAGPQLVAVNGKIIDPELPAFKPIWKRPAQRAGFPKARQNEPPTNPVASPERPGYGAIGIQIDLRCPNALS